MKKNTLADARSELKQRGVNAWDAYVCCVRARNIATQFIDEVGTKVVEMTTRGRDDVERSSVFPYIVPITFLMMLPKQIAAKPIRRPGGGLFIIFIISTLIGEPTQWREDGKFELPMGWAAADIIEEVMQATARSLRKRTEGDCFRCISAKLWGQKKLRRTVTILSSSKLKSVSGTRSIGDRKLNLRTPHK